MCRTDVHETGAEGHGIGFVVMVVRLEPNHELVVAGMRYLVYGGRTAVDVYLEALVVLAGVSAEQFGVCVRHDSGHVGLP